MLLPLPQLMLLPLPQLMLRPPPLSPFLDTS